MREVRIQRLQEYDYSTDGHYFITIVTRDRLPIFVHRENMVEKIFIQTADNIDGVTMDTIIVRPNHVHCIIQLVGSAVRLGEVVRRMKAKTSHSMGQTCWQSNYYEHIIRSEKALENIRLYILHNPLAEQIKGEGADKSARHPKKSTYKTSGAPIYRHP